MKKWILFGICALIVFNSFAQSIEQNLEKAYLAFEKDAQLKAALSSLYVVNAKTGAIVFDKNSSIGLAPASTQKIVTSAAAYELLGRDFRYKTVFGFVSSNAGTNIYIKPSGDPTLGSPRWENTNEKYVLSRLVSAYNKRIKSFSKIIIESEGWNFETIPDGWVWQDIGNYFGAGADAFNWRENQFDLILKSGNTPGEKVEIIATDPKLYAYKISSQATSGAKGSGDNSYIYFPLNSTTGIIRGTIPVNENGFVVSGALPDAKKQFAQTLFNSLKNIKKEPALNSDIVITTSALKNFELLHIKISPPFDSIIYWLNKKSINLYAEALVKTIGFQKAKMGSTEKGVELIKELWKEKGVDPLELNIQDGSGLSPSNRITTHALVNILQYAKKQSWFNGFYNSLPLYNDMKMKSGTIKDVKGYTGYHTSKAGVEYVFCFLVNNYNGSATTLVQKMYKVLDVLK